LLEDLRRRPD